MAKNNALEQERVFAEEAAVVDAQTLLHSVMERKGISRADLARAMNVSRARVTQIFSDECKNFTIRLFARALHALGEVPEFTCREEHEEQQPESWSTTLLALQDLEAVWEMKEMRNEIARLMPCNDQEPRTVPYQYSPLEWEVA